MKWVFCSLPAKMGCLYINLEMENKLSTNLLLKWLLQYLNSAIAESGSDLTHQILAQKQGTYLMAHTCHIPYGKVSVNKGWGAERKDRLYSSHGASSLIEQTLTFTIPPSSLRKDLTKLWVYWNDVTNTYAAEVILDSQGFYVEWPLLIQQFLFHKPWKATKHYQVICYVKKHPETIWPQKKASERPKCLQPEGLTIRHGHPALPCSKTQVGYLPWDWAMVPAHLSEAVTSPHYFLYLQNSPVMLLTLLYWL